MTEPSDRRLSPQSRSSAADRDACGAGAARLEVLGHGAVGLVIFAAMFVGQIGAIVSSGAATGRCRSTLHRSRSSAASLQALALSVIMGLPATLAAVWLAIRIKTALLRRLSRAALAVLEAIPARRRRARPDSWWLGSCCRASPRPRGDAGLHGRPAEIGRDKGAALLLLFAFSVAAPMSEEFFARGFLYRGWSASFLRVPGAIILSSLVWTALHLQYDLFFFGEVFSIGLWFGYMRYRSNSLWLTIVLHGLNNLTAVVQTMCLRAGSSGIRPSLNIAAEAGDRHVGPRNMPFCRSQASPRPPRHLGLHARRCSSRCSLTVLFMLTSGHVALASCWYTHKGPAAVSASTFSLVAAGGTGRALALVVGMLRPRLLWLWVAIRRHGRVFCRISGAELAKPRRRSCSCVRIMAILVSWSRGCRHDPLSRVELSQSDPIDR